MKLMTDFWEEFNQVQQIYINKFQEYYIKNPPRPAAKLYEKERASIENICFFGGRRGEQVLLAFFSIKFSFFLNIFLVLTILVWK